MTSTNALQQRIADAKRTVELRAMQMQAAALSRDEGEIDQNEWDGFAARYAAAVKEWRAFQYHKATFQPAMAETSRGETWARL